MPSLKVLILCNVGSRDVMIEGKAPAPAREEGLRLLQDYNAVAPRLTFPIIEPCLRYILARHPGAVGHLLLLGTDQPDPNYRSTDTLYFAELAARRLPDLFPGLRAEWKPIQGINPALYDEAFEWFDRFLSTLIKEQPEVCYAILSGGTPACNAALLLQGVRHFGDRLRVVYLPQGREPLELRVGLQVVNTFREAAAIEHLERLDFANALPQLERLGAPPGLLGLVRYAAARFAFDFRSAQEALEGALRDGDRPVREFIEQSLRHDLDVLLTGTGPERLRALLRELYWNAVITWEHRRYADFLGRVYRFQEAVLRYLVESIFGLPTDLSPAVREENQRRWNESIAANAALLAYLQEREVDGQPLDWRNIARPAYKALMSYATDEALGQDAEGKPLIPPKDRERYVALVKEVNRLDSLVELRHRTIIGHDFEGVSEEQIRQKYENPTEGLKRIMGMLGIHVKENPYRHVAEFVIQKLKEE